MIDTVIHHDALSVLRGMADNSVDAIVSDPPAGINFMNKPFDDDRGGRDQWVAWLKEIMIEAKRVIRPGGHALIWALPRTSHWTATALEDAGFEVRDKLYHLFGSGFPKSHNISVAIDKHLKVEREVIGVKPAKHSMGRMQESAKEQGARQYKKGLSEQLNVEKYGGIPETKPATPEAAQYAGYGTALKPSCEEWILCRKPLAESSIAAQVLATGTGGLAIDKCRVGTSDNTSRPPGRFAANTWDLSSRTEPSESHPQGRFPSHLLLSHSLWCVPRGTKRVKNPSGENGAKRTKETGNTYSTGNMRAGITYRDVEGMETVEAYDCAPDCPIAELDRQSGVRKSGGGVKAKAGSSIGFLRGEEAYHFRHDNPTSYEASEGGASRYFQHFPPDDYTPYGSTGLQSVPCCLLCGKKNDIMDETKSKESTISCNTIVSTAEKNSRPGALPLNTAPRNAQERQQPESEGKSQRHSTPASNAESNGWNTQATIEPFAQSSAWDLPIRKIAQLVRSAANLCNSCATDIAHDLVRLKLKQDHPLPPGLDSITEISANILRQNLVAYVEHLESTDTIPTIANLTRLFGYVEHAINTYITKASRLPVNELDQIVPYKYVSKASRAERSRGCENLPEVVSRSTVERHHENYTAKSGLRTDLPRQNNHPTVKSTSLMRWLIRLITPPDGIVLDPFCGSGSTCVAAIQENKHFIGIEQDESYVNIANARIEYARTHEPDVVQVATKKVPNGRWGKNKPIVHGGADPQSMPIAFGYDKQGVVTQGHADSEGMEEVEDWDCAPDCPVRILGEQSGVSKSGGRIAHKGQIDKRDVTFNTSVRASDFHMERSEGTAARYFQQFAPDLWTQDMQDAEDVFIAEGGYEGEVSA